MGTLQSDGGLAISRAALPTSAFSPFPYPPSLPLPTLPSPTALSFPSLHLPPFLSQLAFPPLPCSRLFPQLSFPFSTVFPSPKRSLFLVRPPLPFFSLPNLFHLSLRLLSTIGFLLRHKPRSPRRLVSSLSLPSRNLQI